MADPLVFLRDFNRYTGDGLPNAPTGAPLPIGDPKSGAYVPTKKDLRTFVSELAIAVSNEALVLTKADNLAGVASKSTARTNLGLGSAATFATADLPVSTAQAAAIGDGDDAVAALFNGVSFSDFETLDTSGGVLALDPSGKKIAEIAQQSAGTDLTAINAALATAAGTAASLTERLSRGLTPHGDMLRPYFAEWKIRNVKMRLRRLKQGFAGQAIMAFGGDSYTEGDQFWLRQFTKQLHDTYGFAGLGYFEFQWFGTAAGTWVDGGLQPTGGGGCSRGDLAPRAVFNGTWNADNGNQPGGTATPSIGYAESSQVGAYLRFTFPAGHNAVNLHYAGIGSGVIRYSWDGGSTWSANVSLTGTVPAFVALAGIPASSGTLRIEVVSGTVKLAGCNMKSSATGVVVHKIGASGSNSNQWASVNLSTWAAALSSLGVHFVGICLGTNDQPNGLAAETTATNLAAMMAALKSGNPAIDRLILMPAETIRGTPAAIPMTDFAAAVRRKAVENDFPFLDLQYIFGPVPADYGKDGVFPLMDSSNYHPATNTGGVLISDAVHRIIAPVV
jgi:hypothetical protein